ncbi:unnamed protein product [Musa textilis]
MELGESGIERLPELCVAHAISLTSPRDACCLSAVSAAFHGAATSDTVWDRFLPTDWQSLVSRAVYPVEFSSSSSKRDIFFRLCDPILIDDGKMSFSLDRSSGAKCYMLSARELFITWADTPQYWTWECLPESRFAEVAELIDVCWLEIRGKIESRMLSQKTTYAAYLIFRISDVSHGLGYPPQEASVKVGGHSSTKTVCLQPSDMLSHMHARRASALFGYCVRCRRLMITAEAEEAEEVDGAPQARYDDWMELELGEFYIDEGDDGEVNISLLEMKGGDWKKGLIIEGIEIRPKNNR